MAYKPGSFKDTRPQEKGAKAFDKLIQTGGLDKKDFQKAKQLYVQASDAGSREKLKKFIYNLDTEPTEAIMDLIGRNDPETFVKMYPKSKEGERLSTISYAHRNVKAEEVELDERDKKFRYVRPMDRKFSDAQISNIQINQEVQGLYDRIMGKTGIKYKREFMRGVPGRKNKQTHVIVVNKKDKNAANKAVKNYNFSPIEKEVFVKKGHFKVFAVDNLDDRKSWYKEGVDMTEKLTDGNLSLKETVLEMWKEAVSPAQQAAIAISKKERGEKPKKENNFIYAAMMAKKKGEKTFTIGGKEYDVEEALKNETNKNDKSDDGDGLDAVQPKAVKKKFKDRKDKDIDNDGDVDSTDKYLHKRRKAISKAVASEEFSTPEWERYLQTKKGSVRESILKIWGEVNEKVEYVEYKFKNEKDAKAAKAYFDGIQLMSFDVNDDNVRGGELSVDAGSKDMTKYHKEVMKKFRPKVMTQEKKDLTKEKKDDTKKMTDTGKDVTPVDMSPKMPKVKNERNRV